MVTRRLLLGGGGGFVAALLVRTRAAADSPVEIQMNGRPDGSHVWFDPVGLHVEPGTVVRWTNRDRGNSHTVTAYHPSLYDRPARIPAGACAWDSDYLLPGETFSLRLEEEGVYDYYCIPHEHAGMVGRIVVGQPLAAAPVVAQAEGVVPLPEAALNGFPPVEQILAKGIVRRE